MKILLIIGIVFCAVCLVLCISALIMAGRCDE